jgi:glycerol-3-phosphate dehydrogenase
MKRTPTALQTEAFDVLVIGGGITGAGIALDATLRGFRVALIDKGDFASGTSSVSSKLVHGGLRYLEHGDFPLVYEALTERRLLLHNAPHLVQPLRFIIPFYEGSRLPRWQWRLGLTFYDVLAGRGNLHRSGCLNRSKLRHEVPALRQDGLYGGAAYFDAQMDDARLCLEVVKTAAEQGAVVANYVEAVAFERSRESISGARAVDRLANGELAIRARQVVNATGPWVDAVCRLAGDTSGPYLRPTKGVHLIVANQIGLTWAFLLLHPADGRVFFVIPWPRHDYARTPIPASKLLIGTTDTFANDDADVLAALPSDVAYLLEGYNYYLRPPLTTESILGTFSGLRPLLHAAKGDPSAVSREFRVIRSPSGLLSVAGGKFTTYRHMAEVATDEVAKRLGKRRSCRTRLFPLDGTPQESWFRFAAGAVTELTKRYALSEAAAGHLVSRYGRRAFDVAAYLRQDVTLAAPLVPGEPDLRVEWPYQRDQEMAVTPADHWLRRTRLGLYHPELLPTASAAAPATASPAPAQQS